MWVAGLRGAMAYALAMKSVEEFENGDIILLETLLYALITILFIGSILNPLLTYFDVKKPEEGEG
jgi:NhaP-type Na+/H+ or K+/H+ antiporter